MLPPLLRILLILALIQLVNGAASAQTRRFSTEPVYESKVADVPLQPFSLNGQTRNQSSIQVAYYNRPLPRTERIEDEDDEPRSSSGFNNGGSHPTVPGNHAVLRHGIAYAPANAPDRVKNAIWAVNNICNRPYVWGGGHGSFHDYGYDCSGTVSYALHYAGALNQPLASNEFSRFGEHGRGRWFTIYSRRGHTFAVIAGLRLDTTDFRYGGNVGPRWHVDGRDTWGYDVRHPAKL